MRLLVAGPFPPHRGGISQFDMKLAEALGRKAEVMRAGFSRLYPRALFPGTSQLSPEGGPGVRTEADIDSCNPFAWRRTRRRLADLAPEAAVIQWWHPFFAPSLHWSLPGPGDAQRAVICHNIHPHEGFPMGRALASWFLGRARTLVVHSEAEAEKARALFPDAGVLRLYIPLYDQYLAWDCGRDEARAAMGYSREERVILFFGLVRPYKGLEDLIGSFASLPGDCRLLVAGECYAGAEEIRRSLAGTGMSDRTRWDDRFVPDSEVWKYFRAADLVALPYRRTTQSAVAQIALSFGLPLVLTRTGGLPELVDVGVTGYLADPGSPASLAEAITCALELPAGREMEERVARVASRFGWESYADALLGALS